ncbi:hypothetical protein [Yinghuangia seranimata]|uniref:hypothetical protein n=1 Tax=Yinghuangia seranimata TaxID=408067 RepID=UPI00248BCA85|nr:hypothetical protein [Yinghuangia seranimata]MDI2132563.1 hypothetical protein [Yinghuangia seranimata]
MAQVRPYLKLWVPDALHDERHRSAVALARFALSDPDLLEQHRNELLKQAIWYKTQGAAKYGCRYRSAGVLGLEKEAPIKQWWKHLRHEHVLTRASLVQELRDSPDRVSEILERALACVVTPAEHEVLSPFDVLHGWERYKAARIDVHDMKTGDLVLYDGQFVNGGPT